MVKNESATSLSVYLFLDCLYVKRLRVLYNETGQLLSFLSFQTSSLAAIVFVTSIKKMNKAQIQTETEQLLKIGGS